MDEGRNPHVPIPRLQHLQGGRSGTVKKVLVDVDRLEVFPNPSRYRGMLLVAISSNQWVIRLVKQYGHGLIDFPDP